MSDKSQEWYSRYNELLDSCLNLFEDSFDYATPADTGLVLTVVEDFLSDSDTADRDVRTLEMASRILNYKHTTSELPWFDIHSSLVISASTMSPDNPHNNSESDASIDKSLDSIKRRLTRREVESPHTDEFVKTISHLLDSLQSEEAEWLKNTDPYPRGDEGDFSYFAYAVSLTSDSQYGSVEVPNNASRMKGVSIATDLGSELDDRDYSWMIRTLGNWTEAYARAESMIAHERISHSELRTYMMEGETPAERYF